MPAPVADVLTGRKPLHWSAPDGHRAAGAARRAAPLQRDGQVPPHIMVADTANKRIRAISNIESGPGIVTTVAGGGSGGTASPDGVGTSASFGGPNSCVADTYGSIYVSDGLTGIALQPTFNTIRKIDIQNMFTTGAIVTTVAGVTGSLGDLNGPATSALFFSFFSSSSTSHIWPAPLACPNLQRGLPRRRPRCCP